MEVDAWGENREEEVDFSLLVDPALRGEHVGLHLVSQSRAHLEVTNEIVSEHELTEHSSFSQREVLNVGDHEPEEMGIDESADHHYRP